MATAPQCELASPDGRVMRLPQEAFDALFDLIVTAKKNGSVTFQVRQGGVAGVNQKLVVTTDLQYK